MNNPHTPRYKRGTITKDGKLYGRYPDNPSDRKHPSCGRFRQRMEINVLGITNTLTSVGKDNMAYIEYE